MDCGHKTHTDCFRQSRVIHVGIYYMQCSETFVLMHDTKIYVIKFFTCVWQAMFTDNFIKLFFGEAIPVPCKIISLSVLLFIDLIDL